MRIGRILLVAVPFGLWLAVSVAWGWRAVVVFGFFLGISVLLVVGAGIGGDLLTRSGSRHYERLLNGRRRH
jgi:hypothetical protein